MQASTALIEALQLWDSRGMDKYMKCTTSDSDWMHEHKANGGQQSSK